LGIYVGIFYPLVSPTDVLSEAKLYKEGIWMTNPILKLGLFASGLYLSYKLYGEQGILTFFVFYAILSREMSIHQVDIEQMRSLAAIDKAVSYERDPKTQEVLDKLDNYTDEDYWPPDYHESAMNL
jgi:hypothetical protein